MEQGHPSWEELWQQTQALDAQVKQLVKNEKRLYQTQRQIERQFKRINALNTFALEASAAFEPVSILSSALTTLLHVLPLDYAVAFLFDEDQEDPFSAVAVHVRTGVEVELDAPLLSLDMKAPQLPQKLCFGEEIHQEHPEALPFLELAKRHSPFEASPFLVILPLWSKQHKTLGSVMLCKMEPRKISYHDSLPSAEDIPFLSLVTNHLQSTLDNAILHQHVEALASSLESRVERRTQELEETNRELQESLSKLSSAHQKLLHAGKMIAVGTLVAGLSHELNNPISVILGFAQSLLEQTSDDDPRLLGLTVIERQAQRCTRLLRSLLDFSRRETQDKIRCSAKALIERVVELTRASAENHGIRLDVHIEGELPDLELGITDIETALVNLVSNALDASQPGSSISLEASPLKRNDHLGVAINVVDHGLGIAPEVLPRIFEPFFTTKLVGQGTGLGLSLAHKAIELHGGAIRIQSQLDHGTTVSVWLPAAPTSESS